MTARPWGTTGRVVLEGEHKPGSTIAVNVNGVMRGWVGCPDEHNLNWWGTAYLRPSGYRQNRNLPSLDAAVMWVLRRANVDVWRAERGPVWQVRATPTPACPFGPAGWNWWAAPVDPHNPISPWPPLWDGADTPHRGDRTHIRTQAHALATNAHALATEGTP